MTNIAQNDEIDLFELFETLWDGKWQLLGAIIITTFFAVIFLFVREPQFNATIRMSEQVLPSYYSKGDAVHKFRTLFYSKSVYDDWKSTASNVTISFDEISAEELQDGYPVLKDEDELFVSVSNGNAATIVLSVKTNELVVLEQLKRYANHVNQVVTSEYKASVVRHIDQFERYLEKSNQISNDTYVTLLSFYEFTEFVKEGGTVMAISNPTKPKQTGSNARFIVVLAVLLGGILGAVFVLLRKAMRQRKGAGQTA